MGTPGCIVDLIAFKQLLGPKLGPSYDRAEAVFHAYKRKEPLLSYSVASLLLRACETGRSEAVLQALEQAASGLVEWQGSHKHTPNGQIIDRLVSRFQLS